MKKIIAVIDGLKYSDSSTEYAVHVAKRTGSHLVGVFLNDITYHSYKIYELVDGRGYVNEEKMDRLQTPGADQAANFKIFSRSGSG